MSLHKLKLPASVLTDLYSNHLIASREQGNQKEDSVKPAPAALHVLGGNAKRITIVVAEESQSFLRDADLEWLQRMLLACKLNLGDVAIVNLHSKTANLESIREQLKPEKMILLGPGPAELQLPFNFPQFKIQQHNHCNYLYAPSARELNQETKDGKLLRSKLWVSLQQLFEV